MTPEIEAELDRLIMVLPGYDPHVMSEGFHFDYDKAWRAISFFGDPDYGLIRHVKGSIGGQLYTLEDWERGVIANLFGWVDSQGMRRYREGLVYVPRKNSKTTLCAGIALLFTFMDGEHGAENYVAAADRDQASILFGIAKGMVTAEPYLESKCKIYETSKTIMVGDSFFKAISAEANSKHGYNAHLILVDELHAQKTPELVDVLKTSQGTRKQPMFLAISTADFAREGSVCNDTRKYAISVRDNPGDKNQPGYDPRFLPVLYEASIEDDWHSEEVWKRANPNYGKSLSPEYMERMHQKAVEQPSFENEFKRLHLNIQTEQANRWLQVDRWDQCFGDPGPMDCPVVCGLDLATTTDIAAAVFTATNGEHVNVWCRFWIPEASAEQRQRRDKVPYLTWARQGLITLTPGEVIDYRVIRRDINEYKNIREIAYDPWNATQLAGELAEEDGFQMIEFRQGYKSMSEPSKHLEKLVMSGRLRHGANPVLDWMARNVAIETDPAGNIKPSKKHSNEKIDGIVALVMSLGRLMFAEDTTSIYEERGPIVL